MSLGDGNEGLKNQYEGVPPGTLIGTTAQGEELKSWQPLHMSGRSGRQILNQLDDNPRVIMPDSERVHWFINASPPAKKVGLVGTCIVRLDDLGSKSSFSTKELNDPAVVEKWSKQFLNGYAFERLPQVSVLEMLNDPEVHIPIGKFGQGPQPRGYEITWLEARSVHALPDGRENSLYVTETPEEKFLLSTGPANPEFLWSAGVRILLGVRQA